MAEPIDPVNIDVAKEQEVPKKGKKRAASDKEKSGFRKAPGAPKRFKSPYILFSIDRMDKHRKEMDIKTKVTSISRLVSDEWKALSEDERKKWGERAKLDKERYNAEKSLYTGPWTIPSKRSRKDPSAPKRPMSAFLFYSQGKRKELKEQNPGIKNTDISRLLGDRWKAAPQEERLPFIEREKKERDVYNKEIAEWRKQKDEEEKAVRLHRQQVAEQWIKSGYQTHGTGFSAQVYMHMPTHPPTAHGFARQMVPPADMQYFAPTTINAQQQQHTTQQQQLTEMAPSMQDGANKVPIPPVMVPEAPLMQYPVATSHVAMAPHALPIYSKFQYIMNADLCWKFNETDSRLFVSDFYPSQFDATQQPPQQQPPQQQQQPTQQQPFMISQHQIQQYLYAQPPPLQGHNVPFAAPATTI